MIRFSVTDKLSGMEVIQLDHEEFDGTRAVAFEALVKERTA